MKTRTSPTVYDQVIEVVSEYLGPASERFVTRLAKVHCDKKPKDLTVEDIPKLHEWSKLTVALVTEDSLLVDDFSRDLLSIAKEPRD